MDLKNENLIFQLENKKTGKNIYQHEVKLIDFQKEMIKREDVSFFYTFKDIGAELEEEILSKLKLGEKKEEFSFIVKYLDSVLFQSTLDICAIEEKDVKKNEVELYFIFEKISKIIISKISEEHKNIILSGIEKA